MISFGMMMLMHVWLADLRRLLLRHFHWRLSSGSSEGDDGTWFNAHQLPARGGQAGVQAMRAHGVALVGADAHGAARSGGAQEDVPGGLALGIARSDGQKCGPGRGLRAAWKMA
jgi:hypothetical protein